METLMTLAGALLVGMLGGWAVSPTSRRGSEAAREFVNLLMGIVCWLALLALLVIISAAFDCL